VFDESDFPYSTSSTPSPDHKLASMFSDPVAQPPIPVFPFPVGFHGAPAMLPVPAAPRVAPVPPPVLRASPVPFAAPCAALAPSTTPRAAPVPPVVPRAAPAPPTRYAEPVQVYRRRIVPPPA
jgi:hypothetical protein